MPEQLLVAKLLWVKGCSLPISLDAKAIDHLIFVSTTSIGDILLNHLVLITAVCDGAHFAIQPVEVQVNWIGLEPIFFCTRLSLNRIVGCIDANQLLNQLLLVLQLVFIVDDEVFHFLATEIVRDVGVEFAAQVFEQSCLLFVDGFLDLAEDLVSLLNSFVAQVAKRQLLDVVAVRRNSLLHQRLVENELDEVLNLGVQFGLLELLRVDVDFLSLFFLAKIHFDFSVSFSCFRLDGLCKLFLSLSGGLIFKIGNTMITHSAVASPEVDTIWIGDRLNYLADVELVVVVL